MRLFKMLVLIAVTAVILLSIATVPSFAYKIFTMADDGSTVSLKADSYFYVYLPDDPNDGIEWACIPPGEPSYIRPIEQVYIPPKKAGEQGMCRLKFQVRADDPSFTGQWQVYVGYPGMQPGTTFCLNVDQYYPGVKQK